MPQTVFDPGLAAFCQDYMPRSDRAIETPGDSRKALRAQQATLFENLLLFDKVAVKISGPSIPLAVLIGDLGMSGFDSLIEQGALEFVLWNQRTFTVVQNTPGLNACLAGKLTDPPHSDPEASIEAFLSSWGHAPSGRKRRNFVKRLIPLFRMPEDDLSQISVNAVNKAVIAGGLEPYGIPKAPGQVADNLTDIQKHIVRNCSDQFAEYHFLVKNGMTSFSNYSYFSPFWDSAERFRTMNRAISGFSAIATIEGMPDLKALFGQIDAPLKKVAELRKNRNAVQFRQWLESTAGEQPDTDMVKAYLDAIGERKGIFQSMPGKLVKPIAMAAVSLGTGTVLGGMAGDSVGEIVGGALAAGAVHMASTAAEKVAEFMTDAGLGLFDGLILERVLKGWSPRMFFDEIEKVRKPMRAA